MNHVVVLNMDSNGLGVARSLGRLGIPVYGADHNEKAVGFFSKYCNKKLLLPNPTSNSQDCAKTLLRIGESLDRKAVLLPTSDAYVILISRFQKELAKYFYFNIPATNILEGLVDKSRQYALAEELGVPIAKTYYPRTVSELAKQKERYVYPMFIKGTSSHQWQDAFRSKGSVAQNYDELVHHFMLASEKKIPVVVQEIIKGPNCNHYKVCAYYSSAGELLALFSTQKTRQYPVDFGVGSYMISGYYPDLIAIARRFFEGIKYTGVGSIEFKKDEKDGIFKMIELNPRLWQQNIQAAYAGINFAFINYLECIGEKAAPQLEFKSDVVWLDAIQDFQSFLTNRRKGDISFYRWLKSIWKANSYAYFAWDDLKPGWKNSNYGTKYLKLPLKLFTK